MKRRALCTAALATLALAACGKKDDPAAAPAAANGSTPVSIDTISKEAAGFNVGSTMAARVVYVFFDPQCPHCAALWESARPLKSQARFVWVPVGLLNEKSAPQGAAILAASDPVAAMDQHEASMKGQQGGISAMGAPDDKKDAVKRNTALMNRFGFASVPTLVSQNPKTGEVQTLEGAMPTSMLAQKLGLNLPA